MQFHLNTQREPKELVIDGYVTVQAGKTYHTQNFPGLEKDQSFTDLIRMNILLKGSGKDSAPKKEYKPKTKLKKQTYTESVFADNQDTAKADNIVADATKNAADDVLGLTDDEKVASTD